MSTIFHEQYNYSNKEKRILRGNVKNEERTISTTYLGRTYVTFSESIHVNTWDVDDELMILVIYTLKEISV